MVHALPPGLLTLLSGSAPQLGLPRLMIPSLRCPYLTGVTLGQLGGYLGRDGGVLPPQLLNIDV